MAGGSAPSLQKRRFDIESGGLTDTGRERENNEDSWGQVIIDGVCLFVLADGMGGHNAGEVASQMAVEGIVEFVRREVQSQSLPITELLPLAVKAANKAIFDRANAEWSKRGMGATVVTLLIGEAQEKAYYAHLGDSRLYCLRDRELKPLTSDHSLRNEARKKGYSEEEVQFLAKNILTHGLGIEQNVIIQSPDSLNFTDLQANDVFLLCSDGLTDDLSDEVIKDVLQRDDFTPEKICQELIKWANRAGGRDNITAVVVRVRARD